MLNSVRSLYFYSNENISSIIKSLRPLYNKTGSFGSHAATFTVHTVFEFGY